MKIALIPGSFDPFHNGHLEVVERATRLFDQVVVAVVRNPQKSEPLFTLDERQEMLEEALEHLPGVGIVSVSTLVVNVARDVGASAIVKGLRAVSDFENELQMAQMNRQLSGVETIFIPTSSTHSFVASKLLREVARYGGDVSAFVPKVVSLRLQDKFDPRARRGRWAGEAVTDAYDAVADDSPEAEGELDAEGLIRRVVDVVNLAKAMPLTPRC